MERTRAASVEFSLVACMLFAPLLALFLLLVVHARESFVLVGDLACIEARVVHASRALVALGPYSRFGWENPGPIYFYLLLPFHALSSMGTTSLFAGAVCINLASVLAALYGIRGSRSRCFFLFGAVSLSLYAHGFLGLVFLSNIWDPNITVLPFAAFVFLAARLSQGDVRRVLPLTAFFATFLVQTRVGYTPSVVFFVLVALVLCGARRLLAADARRSVGAAAALLVLAWLPPGIEALANPPGNLGKLIAFFASPGAGQSLPFAWFAVANVTNEPLVRGLDALSPGAGAALRAYTLPLFGFQMGLALVAACLPRSAADPYRRNLAVLCLSSLALCVFSVGRIDGVVHMYLIEWMSVLGLVHWCVIAFAGLALAGRLLMQTAVGSTLGALASSEPRAERLLRAAVLCAGIALFVALFVGQWDTLVAAASFEAAAKENAWVGEVADAIEAYVAREQVGPFLIVPNFDERVAMAGVFDQLYQARVPFHVEEKWLHWVGAQFERTGPLADALVFRSRRRGSGTLVHHAAEGPLFVYHVRDSAALAR